MKADDGFLSRWARRKAEVKRGVVEPATAAGGSGQDATSPPASPATEVPATGVPAARSDGQSPTPAAASIGVLTGQAAQAPGGVGASVAPSPAPTPLPTLQDVALLTRSSDYSRFVQPGVAPGVKNAALKKLFSDPHYNIMDGLDTYIDDYGQPDPIPLAMLRQMNQSKALGLFDHEEEEAKAAATETAASAETLATPPLELAASPDGAAPVAVAESPPTHEADPPAREPEPRPDDDADLRLQQDDDAGRSGPEPGPRT